MALVDEWQKYPCLYDVKSDDYHNSSPGSVLVLSAKPLLTYLLCNKCNKKIVVYYNYYYY